MNSDYSILSGVNIGSFDSSEPAFDTSLSDVYEGKMTYDTVSTPLLDSVSTKQFDADNVFEGRAESLTDVEIPGQDKLASIGDGRGGSNDLYRNHASFNHVGIDTRANVSLGDLTLSTKPIRVRTKGFEGSFPGHDVKFDTEFTGLGTSHISKSGFGILRPKREEGVNGYGEEITTTKFGGFADVKPFAAAVDILNSKTKIPQVVDKINDKIQKVVPYSEISVNPSVSIDPTLIVADVAAADGSAAAFGIGAQLELYGRDGLKFNLGTDRAKVQGQAGIAGGYGHAVGLTVRDNTAENTARFNYGNSETAAADLQDLYETGGQDALLSQGSNQYVVNDGRVLNHGHSATADLWNAVNLLNTTINPATDEPVLPLDSLTLDNPLQSADLNRAVDSALSKELISADELANSSDFNFGSTAVADANLANSSRTDVNGKLTKEPSDIGSDFETTPLPWGYEIREDNTLVNRRPVGHNEILDSVGLEVIGIEDVSLGESAARFIDDKGKVLLNNGIRPFVDGAYNFVDKHVSTVEDIGDKVKTAVQDGESNAFKQISEIPGKVVKEFSGIPGSLKRGLEDTGALLRKTITNPETLLGED